MEETDNKKGEPEAQDEKGGWGGAREGAGRPMKFTVAEVIEALKKSSGYVSGAAARLNCSTSMIYNYISEFPEIAEAKQDLEEKNLDVAEIALQEAILTKNMTAIIFFLKTKGKGRGYVEHTTIGGTGPEGEIVVFKLPDGRGTTG